MESTCIVVEPLKEDDLTVCVTRNEPLSMAATDKTAAQVTDALARAARQWEAVCWYTEPANIMYGLASCRAKTTGYEIEHITDYQEHVLP